MRPGGAILSRLMMMMCPRLGLRRGNCCSNYDCLSHNLDNRVERVEDAETRWRRLSYSLY